MLLRPGRHRHRSAMPPTTTTVSLILLVFLGSATVARAASDLDCDFRQECCWEGDGLWTIRQKHHFNINEFRKTFLVGRSKNPPAGNYIIRESFGEDGHYYSCPFCSADGQLLVQFRHWQSPTARLHLCYKTTSQPNTRECQLASTSKQSQVTQMVFKVPRAQKIQLMFLSETTEASMASGTVMIDAIKVQYVDCHAPHGQPPAIPPRPRAKAPVPVQAANRTTEEATARRNSQLSEAVYRKFFRQSSSQPRKMAVKKVKTVAAKTPLQPARQTHQGAAKPAPVTTVPPAPAPQRPPIALPSVPAGKDFNPLNDLLGEQLANFLDPNYVTDDKEEPEETDAPDEEDLVPMKKKEHVATHSSPPRPNHMPTHVAPPPTPLPERRSPVAVLPRKPVQVSRPAPLSELHRPIPLGVPGSCETTGGCLFERGFCSWRAPTDIPVSTQFQLAKVGPSTFIQAKVPSGEVSIVQVDTQMTENHTIVFDALEWQTGSRLIGCCFVNTNLHCPFATPSEQGALLWQISKFECPTGTDKILFICENFGQEEAICGVDNVRLHKSTDIFYLEPCQKSSLSSL